MPRKTKMMQKWDNLSDRTQKIAKLVSAIVVIGGFVIGCCNWGIARINDVIDDHMSNIETQVQKNTKEVHDLKIESELKLSRMELMNLIADYPENVDDILKAAEHYFIDLEGNYVADKAFEDWAEKHGVNVDYIFKKR